MKPRPEEPGAEPTEEKAEAGEAPPPEPDNVDDLIAQGEKQLEHNQAAIDAERGRQNDLMMEMMKQEQDRKKAEQEAYEARMRED